MIWEIMQEWAKCRDAMLPAIAMTDGTHIEDDVIAGLLGGQYKLWVAGASGIVTEFIKFPRVKCLNVFLAGGDLTELAPLRGAIERHAMANGCTRMTALFARPGWIRWFGDDVKTCGTYAYKDF